MVASTPRFARLDCSSKRAALLALRKLQELGIESIESVDNAVSELEAMDVEDCSIDGLVTDLRQHLLSADAGSDLHNNVYEWLCSQGWFWKTVDSHKDFEVSEASRFRQNSVAGSGSSTSCDEDEAERRETAKALAEAREFTMGVVQVTKVVSNTLRQAHTTGDVSVKLEVADSCTSSFGHVSEQFHELNAVDSVCTFVDYPTAISRDAFRGRRTCQRLLMQASISVRRPGSFYQTEREFELLVNLVAQGCGDDFSYFQIITAQGQQVNIAQPERHRNVASRDAVVRAETLKEAAYCFKMALVRATDHITVHVLDGDFKVEDQVPRMWEKKAEQSEGESLLPVRNMASFELKKTSSRTPIHADCAPLTPVSVSDSENEKGLKQESFTTAKSDAISVELSTPDSHDSILLLSCDIPSLEL